MSKDASHAAEKESFLPQPDQSTVIPLKEATSHVHSSVVLSADQFDELLSRVGSAKSGSAHPAIANPGALGLAAFALTTFMLSVFNAGSYLISSQLEPVVLPVALFYGGLAQFLAGMWEFKVNNIFGATAFTSYGSFWMSFAGYVHFILPNIKQVGNAKKATGLYLLAWFIFTVIMNVAASRISRFLLVLFSILNVTFVLLIIGNIFNLPFVVNIGGWFGIATAFVAWYGAAAILINSVFKKPLLPLGLMA